MFPTPSSASLPPSKASALTKLSHHGDDLSGFPIATLGPTLLHQPSAWSGSANIPYRHICKCVGPTQSLGCALRLGHLCKSNFIHGDVVVIWNFEFKFHSLEFKSNRMHSRVGSPSPPISFGSGFVCMGHASDIPGKMVGNTFFKLPLCFALAAANSSEGWGRSHCTPAFRHLKNLDPPPPQAH